VIRNIVGRRVAPVIVALAVGSTFDLNNKICGLLVVGIPSALNLN